MPRQFISPERKFVYYLGMTFFVIGILSFLSIFVSVIFSELRDSPIPQDLNTFSLRAFGGIILVMISMGLMGLGKGGLAGSGLLLDPKRARKDLEPWNRMKGGMVKDALDEAGIDLNRIAAGMPSRSADTGETTDSRQTAASPAGRAPLPFDEQLRCLHALYTDGIISEQEYETKKRQILENS